MSLTAKPQIETAPGGQPSVDAAEIAKFAAMADGWWDPTGAFKPLHRLNPVRLHYVKERAIDCFGARGQGDEPLKGLRLLDIGCGGGLLSEPLARLGAQVLGIDASERNVGIARAHAQKSNAKVTYLACAVEDLVGKEPGFDIVLAMEVVEHVADLGAFLRAAGAMVKPGGMLIVATLNRTAKSFLLAIVGAEYVLRWLPRGTHDWNKFVKPSEIAAHLRASDLSLVKLSGVSYSPLSDRWSLSNDLDVNYMLEARKET